MTPARALLDALGKAGVTLATSGERLRWAAPAGAMTPALIAGLRDHKAEVLALLARAPAAIDPDADLNVDVDAEREAVEERATILEYEAGLPRAWAESAARLLAGLPAPSGCAPTRWAQICDDAAELIRAGWAAKAAGAGWDAAEVLGASPPTRPEARYDAQGLAWLICGRNVADLDAEGATIATATGGSLRFRRRPAGERRPPVAVPAWDLPASGEEQR